MKVFFFHPESASITTILAFSESLFIFYKEWISIYLLQIMNFIFLSTIEK